MHAFRVCNFLLPVIDYIIELLSINIHLGLDVAPDEY